MAMGLNMDWTLFKTDTKTIDGTARSVMSDLSDDPGLWDIMREVDRKTTETKVDRDDVVQYIREEDETIDQKFAEVEEKGRLTEALGRLGGRMMESIRRLLANPETLQSKERMQEVLNKLEREGLVSDSGYEKASNEIAAGNPPQNAADIVWNDTTFRQSFEEAPPEIRDFLKGQTEDVDFDEPIGLFADYDQKMFGNSDQKQEGEEQSNGVDVVEAAESMGADMDALEDYAEEMDKNVEDCAEEWIAKNTNLEVAGTGDVDEAGSGYDDDDEDENVDQMSEDVVTEEDLDQKMEQFKNNLISDVQESVREQMTSDEVVGELKADMKAEITDDEELADELVETIDQKGNFVRTGTPGSTAPDGDGTPVGRALLEDGGEE